MGWLWSSSPEKSDASSTASEANGTGPAPPTSSVALTDEQRIRIFGKPGPAASAPTQTREQQADSELEALIKSWESADGSNVDPSSKSTKVPEHKEEVEEPTTNNRILPDGTLDISPEAIYPRTMSCRQQFDQAFYCQSLGGKFNDIYRYGHLRSCSEQWGAFWFCMRTRTLPEKQKAEKIKEYYAERERRKKEEFGSSEDVWEIRRTAVTRAFGMDPDGDGEGRGPQVEE